jgi:2'-5' RNA ligase
MDSFLVARPTGRLLSLAAEVQESLSEKYNLYQGVMPPLHLTLARIQSDADMGLAETIARIGEVTRRSSPLQMQASGYLRFGPPHLAVGVSIVGDEKLFRLRTELVSALRDKVVVTANDYWKPHITLASTTFGRNWSEDEWNSAYGFALTYPIQAECTIDDLELWYPEFDPRIKIVARFRFGVGLVELP